MNLLQPPRSDYANFFDQARFNLTWKLNTVMFLANVPLVIAAIFFPLEEFLAVLFGWLVPFTYLIVLYLTRHYRVLAIVYVTIGTVTTGGLMNFVATDFHVIELTYMIMISLYAFITLGKTAGIISIAGHCFWVIFYFIFGLNRDIMRSDVMEVTELAWASANFLLAFSMVGFLILEFIKLNRYAEEKYVRSNRELQQSSNAAELRDREKTVILQEIHHRVKNNLQVITSLLRLQAHEVKDKQAQHQFEDAINRVIAMSMIHEKMYQARDFTSLNLEEYLASLSNDLVNSYSINKPVSIVVESAIRRIGNKTIVPLSLLFNELVSNSLKHAFTQRENGEIRIRIRAMADDQIEILYSDNGIWNEPQRSTSFGTELIRILVDQLSGEITHRTDDKGTHYLITLTNAE